jgi:hypothetical protein
MILPVFTGWWQHIELWNEIPRPAKISLPCIIVLVWIKLGGSVFIIWEAPHQL